MERVCVNRHLSFLLFSWGQRESLSNPSLHPLMTRRKTPPLEKWKTRETEKARRRGAWKMATTSFLKTKCEIVPENSYRIIHSLSLPSVIEKAIYRLPVKKKKCSERNIWKPHREERWWKKEAFVSTCCDTVRIIQWDSSVAAKQLNHVNKKIYLCAFYHSHPAAYWWLTTPHRQTNPWMDPNTCWYLIHKHRPKIEDL